MKEKINFSIDNDLWEWTNAQADDPENFINAILRAYYNAHREHP